MTTLKDVANRAGLSVSTVSYVLNGKKKVREDTYRRIMQAVEEVGYVPNQQARSLKTRSTLSIGVVVPDISNQFFPEIVKGIDDAANMDNYTIILCNTDNDAEREERCINALLSKDIDGIIYIGTAKSKAILQRKTELPIVLVDRKLGERYISVTTNNYQGGYMATEHLIHTGHSSIALITGPVFITTYFDRLRGYMDALNANSLHYSEELVFECDFTSKSGYDAAYRLCEQNVQVDAIFATNDLMALSIIRALLELGKKVPEDIAVVGYDDIYIASIVMPALTTIRQPKYEMGKKAAELLIKAIHKEEITQRQIEMTPTLIVRETT